MPNQINLENKEASYCIGIMLVMILGFYIPIFCLYLGLYQAEAYFQNVEAPDIFSKDSLTYLLSGILKPFPVIAIEVYGTYLDEMAKNDSHKIHSSVPKSKHNNIKKVHDGNVV